ncbi:MAG: hypothetical protein ACRDH9_09285 [Actinomycetota bacterium]
MTKTFCDRCGTEMLNNNRLVYKEYGTDRKEAFGVEVMTKTGGTWNGGHLCHDCVRELVAASVMTQETHEAG